MPNRTLLLCAGVGLLVAGAFFGGGLFVSRIGRLELVGNIAKTRTAALSPSRSVIVVDFRARNSSKQPFVVKSVDVEVTFADGSKKVGQFVPEVDAKVLFPALPALGDKLAVSIATRESIAGQETVERMAAATFPVPEEELAGRKSVLVRIYDLDGPVSEIR